MFFVYVTMRIQEFFPKLPCHSLNISFQEAKYEAILTHQNAWREIFNLKCRVGVYILKQVELA